MDIFDHICLVSSWNEKCFWQKLHRKSQYTESHNIQKVTIYRKSQHTESHNIQKVTIYRKSQHTESHNIQKVTIYTFSAITLVYSKNRAVYDLLWKKKYCRAIQAKEDNTAHAHCMLDT